MRLRRGALWLGLGVGLALLGAGCDLTSSGDSLFAAHQRPEGGVPVVTLPDAAPPIDGGVDARMVSFALEVQAIFNDNSRDSACAGCHSGHHPPPLAPPETRRGLHLDPGKSYAAMVGVAASECADGRLLINPGHPESSYLMDKLMNRNLCADAADSAAMPKAKQGMDWQPIPLADIETIDTWIAQGAQNN